MDAAPGLRIRWLGHATAEIDLGGFRILTDPALTPRLGHLRRRSPLDLATVGRPDLVLISHVHQDHLHLPSLRRFGSDVALLVPEGAGGFLGRRGFDNVTETRAGDMQRLGPQRFDVDSTQRQGPQRFDVDSTQRLTIETVPAVHPRGRGPHSSVAADPVGYVVRSAEGSVYFAGDTDLFDDMASLAAVSVALLPIWGWGPSLGEGHLDPATAASAAELIRPDLVVPVHWGTFSPVGLRRPHWLETPAHRFREALAAVGLEAELRQLAPGGSLEVTSPVPPADRAEGRSP